MPVRRASNTVVVVVAVVMVEIIVVAIVIVVVFGELAQVDLWWLRALRAASDMFPNCFELLFQPWAVPALKLDAVPLSLVVIAVLVV